MSSESERKISSADLEFNCPICLETMQYAVFSNCGHSFCGHCILEYWQSNDPDSRVRCPMCNGAVSFILPAYAIRSAIESATQSRTGTNSDNEQDTEGSGGDQDEVESPDEQVQAYCRLFSENRENLGIREQIQEDIVVLRAAQAESPGSKFAMLFLAFLGITYLVSPVDLISETVYGLVGYLDDATVIVLIMFVLHVWAVSMRRAWFRRLQMQAAPQV